MTTAVLFVRMVRWRVAVTLWSFLLIGAAAQGPLRPSIALLLAAASLAASYVVATTVNDIADRDVDRINHPRDPGRPLVTGAASEWDLWRTNAIAAPVALATAAMAGGPVLAVSAASLLIGYTYSLRPVRISYRTWLAPTILSVAYAIVPYALGLLAAGGRFERLDVLLCGALYALFLARINLKDFRDRAGDAAYGKPTLLLAHGKTVTCAVTGIALLAGCATLAAALGGSPGVIGIVSFFAAVILSTLRRLWRTSDLREEQIAIGLGAKMGNGLLACTLTWLVLEAGGAPEGMRVLAMAFLALVFGSVFLSLSARGGDIEITYKG
ncbi:MAG TPA: UbiA family prenyltransferase [Actinomycetota bacterium]|nr:UbiA family prenyltransferase [Actinomycetota bacterium]